MTFKTQTCFIVVCDGCGTEMEFDETTVHFDTTVEAEEYFPGGKYHHGDADHSWTASEGKHRCPDCPPLEPTQEERDALARRLGPGDAPLEGLVAL